MNATRFIAGCGVALLVGACDPVKDDAVAALPGNAPGVRNGPLHRPGQPCLLCHDGSLGAPQEFSIAGTVFLQPTSTQPAQGATVELKGADGSSVHTVSNRAGNFYLTPSQFDPNFPLQVSVVFDGRRIEMLTSVGREGACGGCHEPEAGPDSPGRIYVRLDDGGVPP
jgi:hypothetical protein